MTLQSVFKRLFTVMAIFVGITSCDPLGNYEGTDTFREDIDTFAEFAFHKDELEMKWLCYTSDGFRNGFFNGQVTQQEYLDYFETIAAMSENWDRYQKAIKQMDKKGILVTPTTKGILSSLSDFGTWLTGAGERSRERIIAVASNLPAEERTKLYEGMKSEWKSKAKSESDFWKKLENGDYDTQAPRMFTEFQQDNEEFLMTSWEKNLTTHKIVVAEGAQGLEKGAGVMVDVVGDVTGMGTGMDIANMAVMTGDLVRAKNSSEAATILKDMTKTGIGLYLDLEGFDEADKAKYLMDVADITAKKVSGKRTTSATISQSDRGLVEVSDTDKDGICDIVVATPKNPSTKGATTFVSVGKTSDGKIPVKVNPDNYLVTAVDRNGNKETVEVEVTADKVTPVEVQTISPAERKGSGKEEDKGDFKGKVSLKGKDCIMVSFYLITSGGSKNHESIYNYTAMYDIDKSSTSVTHSTGGNTWRIVSKKTKDKDYDEYEQIIELTYDSKKNTLSGTAKEKTYEVEESSSRTFYYTNEISISFKDIPFSKDSDTQVWFKSADNAGISDHITAFEKKSIITDNNGKTERNQVYKLNDYTNCSFNINLFE